jgi:hypothetical protein
MFDKAEHDHRLPGGRFERCHVDGSCHSDSGATGHRP